jgi:GTP-binding protein
MTRFVQDAKIFVRSGAGGSGCVSFRREKNIEFGGPDGGNGGKGGDVIICATHTKATLLDFRFKREYSAPNGAPGEGRRCTGKAGEDLILHVPFGTEVWIEGEKVADIIEKDQTFVLLRGGKGGAGNGCLKNSVHQTPRISYPGEPGSETWVELKLKLLADVGLIGMPNAGKSTLLNALTKAHSKVGDYPFTTLFPQLGVISWYDKEVVLADLPGLIEDAHLGKGLGHRFLSHAQRCHILLHVLDATHENIEHEYDVIRQELEAFDPKLIEKPEAVILNKCEDLSSDQKQQLQTVFHNKGVSHVFCISALYQQDLEPVKQYIGDFLQQ